MSDHDRLKEMFDTLIRYSEQLRTAQKNRSANKDFKKKAYHANLVKQCEGEFDNVLFNAKQLVK